MEVQEIIALIIGVPVLIAFIALLWYCAVTDLKYRQAIERKRIELEERKVIAIEKYVNINYEGVVIKGVDDYYDV